MIRGTTPTFTFTLDYDLSLLDEIYITIKQDSTTLEYVNADLTIDEVNSIITLVLPQEDSLSLRANSNAKVQLKATATDGNIVASYIGSFSVSEILNEVLI